MSGNHKGFTLTELMVVVVMIGVLGLITGPNIVSGLPKYRVKNAARTITSKLRMARSTAVKKHRDITVFFDVNNSKFSIDGAWFPGQDQNLTDYYGSGVCFGLGNSGTGDPVTLGGDSVTFNSRGLSNGGSVHLTNNSGDAYKVTVNTAGRIRMTHWTGSGWE
jgi:prepilin-type N-terminal cleavage/methylation domain-containing protein